MSRWIGLGIWVLLLVWMFFFPGGTHQMTGLYLQELIGAYTFQSTVPPELFLVFNFLGLWPLVAGLQLFSQDPVLGRFRWKLTFWLLSFVGGAFALSPYLLFEKRSGALRAPRWLEGVCRSPYAALVLGLGGLGLTIFGFMTFDPGRFVDLATTSSFFRVMLVDLVLFQGWTLVMVWEDQRARNVEWARVWQMLFMVPFFGVLIYLAVRDLFNPTE